MERSIPLILQWDENFDVGADTGTPVDDQDYQIPFQFNGDHILGGEEAIILGESIFGNGDRSFLRGKGENPITQLCQLLSLAGRNPPGLHST
jgi:hypothetical protein